MAVRDDYNQGSVDCCLSHLIEVFTILGEFREHIALVGGWVPFLLCNNPEDQHCGSMDIDLAFEFDAITDETYDTILNLLQQNGFTQGAQPFIFTKETVTEDGIPFKVEIDLLAGEYGGTSTGHRHQDIQNIKARKARGADLVFKDTVVKTLKGKLPDGGINEIAVKIAGVVPFLVMKGMALWTRRELKDAYDIFYVINNYQGGMDELVKAFEPYREHGLVIEGLGKIRAKFMSPEHVGPVWVADFQVLSDPEEVERIKRDAYEKISRFLDLLSISKYEGE